MRCNARVPRNNRNKKEFSVLIRAMRENDGFRERRRERETVVWFSFNGQDKHPHDQDRKKQVERNST